MSFVLANATLASLAPRTVGTAHLVIEGGRIRSIGTEPPPESLEVIDCSGKLIMPGNVCVHTHLYSALARGMPAPKHTPRTFPEILEHIWWRLDRALDDPSIRSSGLVGALDAARSGTTTLVDHHASPNYIDGSLDVLAEAIDQVGLRAVLCYEVTDRGGRERRDAGLRENERFLREGGLERISGVVGAHASFTLEDDTLDALSDLADRFSTGIHIHVAEDRSDQEDSLRRCGRRVTHRLDDAGILRPRSIAAHVIHVDRNELEVLKQRETWLVHNCRSNLNNSVGRAPILQFGKRSALGTDGIDGDMMAESRTAYFRAREEALDAFAEQFTDLLGRGGELASQFFPAPVGRLEEGAVADLVILDYDPPTPLTSENIAWHWMFAMTPKYVKSVMVDGAWVVRNGEFCNVDEERIRAEARTQARSLWKRMEDL